jgi:hypothetical protein
MVVHSYIIISNPALSAPDQKATHLFHPSARLKHPLTPPGCQFTLLNRVLTSPDCSLTLSYCQFTTLECLLTLPECLFTTPDRIFTNVFKQMTALEKYLIRPRNRPKHKNLRSTQVFIVSGDRNNLIAKWKLLTRRIRSGIMTGCNQFQCISNLWIFVCLSIRYEFFHGYFFIR